LAVEPVLSASRTLSAKILFAFVPGAIGALAFSLLSFPLILEDHSRASALSLEFTGASDGQIVRADRLFLSGIAKGAKELLINNVVVETDAVGAFRVGLVLKPGKNLINIVEKGDGAEGAKRIRVLRLVSFPDMESLYEGIPHWAKRDVEALATLGVVEGYPDGDYYPKLSVSRGELATWLVKALDDRISHPSSDPFPDVPKEHWRAPYVKAAAERGYLSALPNGKFGIDSPIRRGEAARAANAAENLDGEKAPETVFLDVRKADPEFGQIYLSYKAGYIKGVSTEKLIFQPARALTRAEAATLISRFGGVSDREKKLFDLDPAFEGANICAVNTEPKIISAQSDPNEIIMSEGRPVLLTVDVEDEQGMADISQVKIDLRAIGGPPDALMYDDGENGDELSGDGVYSLEVVVPSMSSVGAKRLWITVTDKSGWQRTGWIDLTVNK
jgi:hypothetical protein